MAAARIAISAIIIALPYVAMAQSVLCSSSPTTNGTSVSCSATQGIPGADTIWAVANADVSSVVCDFSSSMGQASLLLHHSSLSNLDLILCRSPQSYGSTTTGASWSGSAGARPLRAIILSIGNSEHKETIANAAAGATSLTVNASSQQCNGDAYSVASVAIRGSLPTVTATSGWALVGGNFQTATISGYTRNIGLYYSPSFGSFNVTLSAGRDMIVAVSRFCKVRRAQSDDIILWD
ncbi:MAG: hypothetical protein QXT45_05100 [Candidatus Bilamarchaeaceae archaeon]